MKTLEQKMQQVIDSAVYGMGLADNCVEIADEHAVAVIRFIGMQQLGTFAGYSSKMILEAYYEDLKSQSNE